MVLVFSQQGWGEQNSARSALRAAASWCRGAWASLQAGLGTRHHTRLPRPERCHLQRNCGWVATPVPHSSLYPTALPPLQAT